MDDGIWWFIVPCEVYVWLVPRFSIRINFLFDYYDNCDFKWKPQNKIGKLSHCIEQYIEYIFIFPFNNKTLYNLKKILI